MATRKIGPAIAAGCTSILKPAALTPLTSLLFAKVLEEVGVPAGVVNVIQTSRVSEVTAPIIKDSRLRKLSFTGSTPVGKMLIKDSADQVLRTSMELGGNAPFLVFEDADVDKADAVDAEAIVAHEAEVDEAEADDAEEVDETDDADEVDEANETDDAEDAGETDEEAGAVEAEVSVADDAEAKVVEANEIVEAAEVDDSDKAIESDNSNEVKEAIALAIDTIDNKGIGKIKNKTK